MFRIHLSHDVYPHRQAETFTRLRRESNHLWNASLSPSMLCQLNYAVRWTRVCDISELSLVPSISTYIISNVIMIFIVALCTNMLISKGQKSLGHHNFFIFFIIYLKQT